MCLNVFFDVSFMRCPITTDTTHLFTPLQITKLLVKTAIRLQLLRFILGYCTSWSIAERTFLFERTIVQ